MSDDDRVKALLELITQYENDNRELAARYDDAMKRISDLEAELEFLRREVNRG